MGVNTDRSAAKTVNRFPPKRQRPLRWRSADGLAFRFRSKAIDARRICPVVEPHQAPLWASQQKETPSNNQPTLIAYSVKERREGKKAIWSKIGAAFPHDNGKGLTIQLDAQPLGDRIVLTEPKREEAQ